MLLIVSNWIKKQIKNKFKRNEKWNIKVRFMQKLTEKYIECTETVQQLEDKISKLESALENQKIINEARIPLAYNG